MTSYYEDGVFPKLVHYEDIRRWMNLKVRWNSEDFPPRGVYGLRCPLYGKIRYVGSSNNLAQRYEYHCSYRWEKTGCGEEKRTWITTLREKGLRPELVWLEECVGVKARLREKFYIQAYELIGEADFNVQFSASEREKREEVKKNRRKK